MLPHGSGQLRRIGWAVFRGGGHLRGSCGAAAYDGTFCKLTLNVPGVFRAMHIGDVYDRHRFRAACDRGLWMAQRGRVDGGEGGKSGHRRVSSMRTIEVLSSSGAMRACLVATAASSFAYSRAIPKTTPTELLVAQSLKPGPLRQ